MTLEELLKKLARGKLSNLPVASGGEIRDKDLVRVVDAVNEGIARLYTLFPLKEKNLILEVYEGRTEYELTSEHSFRKWTGKEDIHDPFDFYIRDTDEHPFEDDIQTISEVWDDLDRLRPLNDPDDPLAVFTPQQNWISLNFSPQGRVLNIIYWAKHKLLTADDLTEIIELPTNLIGALLSFTAYSIHGDMNTEIAVQNSQKYYAEYQAIVKEVVQNGTITPDKLVSAKKFIRRGWV